MKIAVAFLLLTLGCFFETSTAFIEYSCIQKLMLNDQLIILPKVLGILCEYKKAKETGGSLDGILEGLKTLLPDCFLDGTGVCEAVKNVIDEVQWCLDANLLIGDLLCGPLSEIEKLLECK